nr:PREDICTED: uncharacterized protein LOC109038633 [Bemisia tabaci]
MISFKCICLFASIAIIQANLQNRNDLYHPRKGSENLRVDLIKPPCKIVEELHSEEMSNLNDEQNLVGDDRIPLDYDINEIKSEVKETRYNEPTNFGSKALDFVEDGLFNHPNAQYDFQECINAMANIVEEERLMKTIKNLTMDAISIISNASVMIVECQEKNSFPSCLVSAVNELGAAFIGVSEDIERAVMATVVLTQKLYEQIKLCIGGNDVPVSAIVNFLLRLTQSTDSTHLKNSVPNEIPKVPQEPSQRPAHKWYPFLREHRHFINL